jgi:hypothetical protein
MKVGQIVKVNSSGLMSFPPGIRSKLKGQIGLVMKEKYDLAHKLDQAKLPDRVKVYPALVKFDALMDLNFMDDGQIMLFSDQAEVLS